jgi:hypothetical protein
MARRPEFPAKAMTREELKELRRSLSLLSPHTVRDNYNELLASCRLRDGTPPPPRTMQRLVTLWKILWRWRG